MMTLRICAGLAALAFPLFAQEAQSWVAVPITVSGGALYSHRLQVSDRNAAPQAAGFRAMLYPTLKLGSHWMAYAALQVHSTPYFYYDAYSPKRQLAFDVIQAFGAYTVQKGSSALVFKAGRLASAFGSFPLRYDDAENPVLDQPLSYIQTLTVRADQLACGTADLLRQHYGSVQASCGGAAGRARGLTPVTLYGLPGMEADFAAHRFDGRFQLTNGSPANPQGWGTYALQWTAGGGYTIRQGFRVGASAFRGPYLDSGLASLLPAGTGLRDFPATASALDVQWAHGRWSLGGEWQRLHFSAPHFVVAPSLDSTYVEAKTRLTPRYFLAGRAGWLQAGRVLDDRGVAAASFAPLMTSVEFAAGGWLNRRQLLKLSYEALKIEGQPGTRFNVVGFQFITMLHSLELPLH